MSNEVMIYAVSFGGIGFGIGTVVIYYYCQLIGIIEKRMRGKKHGKSKFCTN